MAVSHNPQEIEIAIATLSHHCASVAEIEAFRFQDEGEFLHDARGRFSGVVLLQTCNRVEVIVHGRSSSLDEYLKHRGRSGYGMLEGDQALRHLLELASGMDSMIVGEDQIIGQLRQALRRAEEAKAMDPYLRICMEKAIHVGIQVRQRTRINRGAVSIGSAAVELADKVLGGLEGCHILVIGAGEMGSLVAKALAERGLTAIYVANRTYERAVKLAEEIGGRAVRLSDLYRYIGLSDVVISCTSAPHPIIYTGRLKEALEGARWPLDGHPKPLVIIDIAQPRDVEEGVREIAGVHLYTIDDLRSISESNLNSRKAELEQARTIVEEELAHCRRLLMRSSVEELIAALYTWAEAIRRREKERAMHRLRGSSADTDVIIEDLTNALVHKLLAEVTHAMRECGENGDMKGAEKILNALTRRSRTPRSR